MNDIKDIIQQAIEACHLELYWIDQSSNGLVVYIENKDNTIGIKDCEMVMKQITYSTNTDNMNIEISSKGVYPSLFCQEHYQASIEKWVKVRTNDNSFKGKLVNVTDNMLQLERGENQFDIPFNVIKSAKVIPTPKGE